MSGGLCVKSGSDKEEHVRIGFHTKGETMDVGAQLLTHLRAFPTAPYLFVGAGLSRRYLSLPGWEGLLNAMCDEHNINFGYLRSSAAGDLPKLATLIAQELQKKWWTELRYDESRIKFSGDAINNESAFKIETAIFVSKNGFLTNDEGLLEELDALKKIVVDGIITTNWDGLLEHLFPSYVVYVGQEGLIFSNVQGIGEIYKIHGTAKLPGSLVVTEKDYAAYHGKNPYLASKLITFFVENPVVFLGYSLTDKNILKIIHSILDCLEGDQISKLADRLVFVQWDENCKVERMERTILSHEGRSLPVFQITTGSMLQVYQALGAIKRKIPAKILRMLKKQVYELVHNTKSSSKIFVQDINEDTDVSDIEYAIGVGLQDKLGDRGYDAIHREDIVEDVLFENQSYRASAIVNKTLPELLKRSEFVPVFRYVSLARKESGFDVGTVQSRVSKALKQDLGLYRKQKGKGYLVDRMKAFKGTFTEFTQQHHIEHVMMYAEYIPIKSLKHEEIHEFLKANYKFLSTNSKPNIKSAFFKMVWLYDFLRFKSAALAP